MEGTDPHESQGSDAVKLLKRTTCVIPAGVEMCV